MRTEQDLERKKKQLGDDSGIIKCGYDLLTEVHKHRYLLREVAVELFSTDGRDHLLACAKPDRDEVYTKLLAATAGVSRLGAVLCCCICALTRVGGY